MSRLAVALGVAAVLVSVPTSLVVAWAGWAGPGFLLYALSFSALGVACGVTGAALASRVPSNAVGWLILGIGLGTGVLVATAIYSIVGTTGPWGRLPGTRLAAWISNVAGTPALFGCTGFLLLLFPTGRPQSRPWLWAAWSFGVLIALATVSTALVPGPLDADLGITNPFGLPGRAGDAARFVVSVTDWIGPPAMLVCAAALGARLRSSRGVERQQLKWFTYAAVLAGASLGVTILASGPFGDAAFLLSVACLIMLPVTAGVAILRHRLYDIDLVIKRTLVYGTLTAALATTYLVMVLVLQPLLRPVAGDSDLAVAASTLAVAALFRPLRSAIQHGVDRRFFRSRYDAAHTMTDFAGRLRHEVDLDSLGNDLRAVVRDTMQPAHLSLWLRSDP